jgi:tRNA pseudouridine38-40 synthase
MPAMRAFRLAYDGRPYRGFQRQPDVPTVEDRLLDGLRALDVADDGPPPGYAAAGRTDAGVSAAAQTVAFEAPDWLSPAALNSELPESIRAWASAPAPPSFHATHHATRRTYTYFLYAPEADESAARRALAALDGDHDFHNFTPDETGTRRTLSTGLERDGSLFVLTFSAGGFARQLVRRLVAVVAEIARGEAGLDRIDRLLGPDTLSGPEGVGPAPPEPLVLTDVEYPDLSFEVDAEAAATARTVFERLRAERTASARVAGSVSDLIENREGNQ